MAESIDALEERARAGDARAFGALIRQYDPDLRGVAWAVVRTADATDDVMQAAYEKAFRSIGTFDGRSALKTWLHSIVHRTALDHVRYAGRRRHEEVGHADERGAVTRSHDAAEQALDRVDLARSLDGLDADHRAALMLTVGLGHSYDEAAEILGQRRGTVASRVNRARKKIVEGNRS